MFRITFDSLPDNVQLQTALSHVFSRKMGKKVRVKLLARRNNIYSSSFATEIVSITLEQDETFRLFLKYEPEGILLPPLDNRQSLFYEAKVYEKILSKINMTTPGFFGFYRFPKTNLSLLVLEFRDQMLPFSNSRDPEILNMVVDWIAEFHQRSKQHLKNSVNSSFLCVYDRAYYFQHLNQLETYIYASHLKNRFSWMLELINQWKSQVNILIEADQVILHGEFYPQNVLSCGTTIFPVDWQTTAIGAGEIDLGSALENWPEGIVESCLVRYRVRMQDNGSEIAFRKRMMLINTYLQVMWLVRYPQIINQTHWRVKLLKQLKDQF